MVLAYFSCCYHASRYRARAHARAKKVPFEGVFWRAHARYLDTTTTTTTTTTRNLRTNNNNNNNNNNKSKNQQQQQQQQQQEI